MPSYQLLGSKVLMSIFTLVIYAHFGNTQEIYRVIQTDREGVEDKEERRDEQSRGEEMRREQRGKEWEERGVDRSERSPGVTGFMRHKGVMMLFFFPSECASWSS